jgi:hypothetical protein
MEFFTLNVDLMGHLAKVSTNKAHQARTHDQKLSVQTRKKKIQDNFREKLSLIVDVPKIGYGNTNDGNTSRRAFSNADVFSEITGVNVEVITRLRTVLIALNSGFKLNTEIFTKFCHETSEFLVTHYGWYVIKYISKVNLS